MTAQDLENLEERKRKRKYITHFFTTIVVQVQGCEWIFLNVVLTYALVNA